MMTSAASLGQAGLANPLSSLSRGSTTSQPTASTARWSTNPPPSTSHQPGTGAGMSTPAIQGSISNKPFASFAGPSAGLRVVTPQPLLAADDPFGGGSALGSLMPTPSARHSSLFQQQASQQTTQQPAAPQSYAPYPAQERLYYQAEFRKHKPKAPEYSDKSRASASTESVKASTTSAEDAPPRSSLYEMNISPGLKYLRKEAQRPSIQSPAGFHPMDVDQTVSSPAPKAALPNGDTEVTVFGFPSSASASVLAMFRQVGAVERHEMGAGNWIHLRYTSSWSANKALSKNGRVFPTGAFMIGVMPAREARRQLETAGESFMTPARGGSAETPRVSFNLPTNEPENIFFDENAATPTARHDSIFKTQSQDGTMSTVEDDSIVARLVRYVFGW